ncbi:GDP-L-fucose synthase family protein [Caulobacter endophyticus]|uniref:GDP-L-fucose synthase n=1 Tax=Caulobacter endophyticus TaxID=2172652 RepID=A0A2T9JZJ8_9CAUL|nr:GDP-L-fucose synthase [Caulobacter endophyticus]PVM89168.1 GDP-fucose synthetase [Caulobacter endophyticus]
MSVEIATTDSVLVTGAGGLVGSALVEELRSRGVETVLAPRRGELNLLDQQAVFDYFEQHRPVHVFHPAAKVFGLGGNTRFPGEMFYENALININVIEACRRFGVRKITALGTGCVYPESLGGSLLREDQVWDGAPHGSEWAYAQAKRAMLAQLVAYQQQYELDFVYAISGNLYGPGDLFDAENGHVIPSLVAKFHRALTEGGKVTVWGTGRAERDFCFSSDTARALIMSHEQLTGPVNMGSGVVVTIRDVVEGLVEVTNGAVELEWDATKPDGQMRRFYDLSKLQSIGFQPQFDLKAGLRSTYEWYAKNYPHVRR